MWKRICRARLLAGIALFGVGVGLTGGPARAQRVLPQQAGLPAVSLSGPCLRYGRAYLRASIRGAERLDVDLHGSQLSCEGGPRLDGSGIRIGFEGRVGPGRRPLRLVFGIDGAREGLPGEELPTNLTVIFEGGHRLFATQGDRNCTVDRLRQERIGEDPGSTHPFSAGAKQRSYLVTAHGFCVAPANDLGGRRRIIVTTFDFAGRADFEPPPQQR